MKIIVVLAVILAIVGCSHVDNTATEGKNAFQTGMRSSEKAKDLGAEKEAYDRQSDEF